MNRLLKFFYRFQNQRRIHRASFWTIVKMDWAQSGRADNDILVDDNLTINEIPIEFTISELEQQKYNEFFCRHEYEYSNDIKKCLKCGKMNRYYLKV